VADIGDVTPNGSCESQPTKCCTRNCVSSVHEYTVRDWYVAGFRPSTNSPPSCTRQHR
jgi:hypothetical protein